MNYLEHMLQGGIFVEVLIAFAVLLWLAFAGVYLQRSLRMWWQLRRIAVQLASLRNEKKAVLRDKLRSVFTKTWCAHAWREYGETLHDRFDFVDGERRVLDVRATAPADAFINAESIVEPRLYTEFFRHVPGILTGLGIIGTFYGLIHGLMEFDPGVEAEELKLGLGGLFGYVRDAFTFSMAAIASAMLITVLEKWAYAACTKRLGQVTSNLDSLFRSGLGEEYLSDLVQASQDSATQTRQLKESLVQDLKELLVGLTERQIAATQEMSSTLGQHIESSLKAPLASIAETVRHASGEQTAAASATLESLMRAFMDRMQEVLGGQLSGMGELLQTSAQSMSQVEATLRTLVVDMQRTSSESAADMQQAVQTLLDRMQMEQERHAQQSAASVDEILSKVGAALENVSQQQQVMRDASRASMEALNENVQLRVEQLAAANEQAHAQSAALTQKVAEVSTDAVDRMQGAAQSVADALAGVAQATTRLQALAENFGSLQEAFADSAQKIATSSVSMGGATQSLSTAIGSLGSAAQRLDALGSAVESETQARSAMLQDMRAFAEEARGTGHQLTQFTRQVDEQLAEQLERFGGLMTKALETNLGAYNEQLKNAVSTLRTAYEELASMLERE